MSFYEHLPHELARVSVLRKATGLDLNQVMECVRLAQERETLAGTGPEEPKSLSELHIAYLPHNQGRSIAHVMAERHMPVYEPTEAPVRSAMRKSGYNALKKTERTPGSPTVRRPSSRSGIGSLPDRRPARRRAPADGCRLRRRI